MGKTIDFGDPNARLPARIVVDSNLVIAHLLTAYHTPFPVASARADRFFRALRTDRAMGIITSTIWAEASHFVIYRAYQQAIPQYRGVLTKALPRKRRFDWQDLYKVRPDLISLILPDLGRLRSAMRFSALTFLQPSALGPLPSGQPIEVALEELIGRYQLDTSDAAILLDAQRAGIASIATLDGDLRRAARDFDVYTWL